MFSKSIKEEKKDFRCLRHLVIKGMRQNYLEVPLRVGWEENIMNMVCMKYGNDFITKILS